MSSLINIVVPVIGTALLGSGLYGILSPVNMARTFGIINPSPSNTIFYPGLGGRNLAAGLIVWTLFLTGQRESLGYLIGIWGGIVGPSDTYLLLKYRKEGGGVDNVGIHVFNTCLLVCVGGLLVRGN